MKFSYKVIASVAFIMVFGIAFGDFSATSPWFREYFFPTVFAEDDEYEFENEKDDESDTSMSQGNLQQSAKSTSVKTRQVIQNVIEYKPVTKTVVVTEEEYRIDSDGDLLVDAIDPNPLVKQDEYFTDTDGDGVPNVFDRHHDEDDFSYFDDAETDVNINGIFDSYEQ